MMDDDPLDRMYYTAGTLYLEIQAIKDVEGVAEHDAQLKTANALWEACSQKLMAVHAEQTQETWSVLGDAFTKGRGGKSSRAEAIRWFPPAVGVMHPQAMLRLGFCLQHTDEPSDIATAIQCFREAATHGDACAMTWLGASCREGRGVPYDPAEAVQWFTKAVRAGSAHALIHIGQTYATHFALPVEALIWFRVSVKTGFSEGIFEMLSLYHCRLSGVHDEDEYKKWERILIERNQKDLPWRERDRGPQADGIKSHFTSDIFPIPQDWEYTKSRTKDGIMFAFHSSKTCPGYSVEVSNWRLRKCAVTPWDEEKGDLGLISWISLELRRVFGKSMFKKSRRISLNYRKALKRMTWQLRRSKGLAGLSDLCICDRDTSDALAIETSEGVEAKVEELYGNPRIALLSRPMVVLSARDKTPHILDYAPWPFPSPPHALRHLAPTGFASLSEYGILALAPGCEDVWIVSKFHRSEVKINRNREATIEKEHPQLKQWAEIATKTEETNSLLKGIRPYVLGIPKVMADFAEARQIPEEAALKLHQRITEILTPQEQTIWRIVRTEGTQKAAFEKLQEHGIKSLATLSRRVKIIDEKLKKNDLPPCLGHVPATRFLRSGGLPGDCENVAPNDLSSTEYAWDKDPHEFKRTILSYLASPGDEKEAFHQSYPGIERRAEEYRSRHLMKSD